MHHSPFKIEYHSRFPLNGHLAHGDYFDPNFEEIFNEGLLSMLNNEDATDKITSDKKQVLVGLLPSKLAEIRFNITIKDKYLEVNFFNVNIETFKIKETKAPSGYIAGESKEVTLEGFTLFDYKEYDEATNEAAKQREIKIRKDLEDFTRKNHVRLVEFKNKEDFEKDYHSVGDRIKAKFHSPIKLDIINKLDPKEEKPKEEDQVLPEKPKQNDHKDMVVPKENDQNIFNKQKENKPEAQKNMQMKESGKSKKDMPNKNLNAKANKDKSMKNPKTGDNNDIVLYSSIVAIAGLSLLAVGFLKKKNNKEEII
ncbi:LPXTG cell wall anchor domain-containing protein [Helcococcus kunzii]|uniref:LPXTG cell wall anchor domain-containing protein n=1 Tax=Helcococcus kunzii TaxID=40091 RepID=UPI001C95613D|nr:LPXTG cell wall anchor domain-containing protein [Helcococcus kunzii]QZO76194.1 LPXTG cell wall anchor domain-containing protein [Helcococcus kunzii]